MCGQFQVCDVRWVDDVFSEYDMDRIDDDDIHPNHNVYPSSPGRFQPHLVVFVDHPNFDFASRKPYVAVFAFTATQKHEPCPFALCL